MCEFATQRRDFLRSAGIGLAAAGLAGSLGIRSANAAQEDDYDHVNDYLRDVKIDKAHYDKVIATKGKRKLRYEAVCQRHTGDAYPMKAGDVIRLEQRHERTQIADLLFVTPDLTQISDSSNTFILEGLHPRVYSRLWSQSKFMQPMVTMVAEETPDDFASDKYQAHFWGPHCCGEWIELAYRDRGVNFNSCHMNFVHGFNRIPAVHAIEDAEERKQVVETLADRWDLNVFQPAWYKHQPDGNRRGSLQAAPPVPKGTGIEFYAEMDQYLVISNCPVGDQKTGQVDADPQPLYISVHETGIEPLPSPKTFHDWETHFYDLAKSGKKDISPRTLASFRN